jgi:hypothetical protein
LARIRVVDFRGVQPAGLSRPVARRALARKNKRGIGENAIA